MTTSPPTSVRATTMLREAIPAYALFLILYLPIETALLSGLAPLPYWTLRLLPDAIIALAALAVVLIGDPRARTTPIRILWVVGLVSAVLIAANAARGVPIVDSVNAIRLLVRYLILGLLVWWALDGARPLGPHIVGAILLGGAVQVVIGTVQVLTRLPEAQSDPSALFFLDGTFGRYDRFGLFLMTVMVAIVATTDRFRPWHMALFVACVPLLHLSTSRQAIVALGAAAAVLFLWPRVPRPGRTFALATGMLAVALLFVSPDDVRPPQGLLTPDTPGEVESPSGPTRPIKASTDLSLDPNRNFRLFYNLRLAPFAASAEPILGFGPRQQVAVQPDPRLSDFFESAGMPWAWARNFTNDSNFASMVVQFGVVAPALFLLLLAWSTVVVARAPWLRDDSSPRFAVVFVVATLVAAWFGPAFEIRTVSIVLWVGILAAVAATHPAIASVPAPAVAPPDRLPA